MLGRLGIAGRLLLIALLVLFAALAIGTSAAFVERSSDAGTNMRIPVPDQVAAIVELLEREAPEDRPVTLRAVNSGFLSLTISERRPELSQGSRRMPGVEWFVDQYLSKTGEHEIYAWDELFERGAWGALFASGFPKSAGTRVRIAVSLQNGGFAVFETRSEIVRIFGLPVGLWVGLLGTMVAFIAVSAILKEAKPLQALAAAVQRFAVTATPVLLEPAGAKETKALAAAVNDMQTRIASLLMSRTVLLGAISHDLKTSLTRLRLRIEGIPDPIQYEKAAADLDYMTKLIDDALAAAKSSAVEMRRERVDIFQIIEDEVAERRNCHTKILSRSNDSIIVDGDPVALRRLLANLLDNATRYGTRCVISLTSAGSSLMLQIDDDGPGIAPMHREAVFEPFYRIESSRSRETGGTGLGLAIAKQIAVGHRGSISISDAALGGARFTVVLPKTEI